MTKVAAVDIGATSGRVVLADLVDGGITLDGGRALPNAPAARRRCAGSGTSRRFAIEWSTGSPPPCAAGAASCGIDTWAVDYGVIRDGSLRRSGARLPRPAARARDRPGAQAALSWDRLYGITGIQHMPINTIYQIAADEPQRIIDGTTFLLVPDLLT